MVDKIRILYYLEDRAQEDFITSLVKRVAVDEQIAEKDLKHNIRSARGGQNIRVFINDFKEFIKDRMTGTESNIIIVSVDGNCEGHTDRINKLKRHIKENHPFKEKVVYAVPDPHIERWYLMDQKAFKVGVGIDKAPELPQYKCDKNYYKDILHRTLKESGINSLLGGAEYAERIVNNMEDLYSLGKQDEGFKEFVDRLKTTFRTIKRVRGLSV